MEEEMLVQLVQFHAPNHRVGEVYDLLISEVRVNRHARQEQRNGVGLGVGVRYVYYLDDEADKAGVIFLRHSRQVVSVSVAVIFGFTEAEPEKADHPLNGSLAIVDVFHDSGDPSGERMAGGALHDNLVVERW
jgi:hypothetical protein